MAGITLKSGVGYIAIAIFMTGDGFELAFLSHYIKALGFTPAEASFAFYALWPGGSAFRLGFRRSCRNYYATKNHVYRLVLWCVFHVLFLVFGLGQANYGLILLFYGIRA